MAYWWVNHKQTRDHRFVGATCGRRCETPKGVRNQSYENMACQARGTCILVCAWYLGAIGRVIQPASASPKPIEFGTVGDYWSNEGWLVDVIFDAAPQTHPATRLHDGHRSLLPQRYSPIQANGHGNQGNYLGDTRRTRPAPAGIAAYEIRDSDGRNDIFVEALTPTGATRRYPRC